MSTAKEIQAKVFRGQGSSPSSTRSPTPGVTPPSSESPSLSIRIPKTTPPPSSKDNNGSSKAKIQPRSSLSSTEKSRQSTTFQERLLKKLGTRYDGVERYRLEEDERKDKHWKRWGPYLSERQWASCLYVSVCVAANNVLLRLPFVKITRGMEMLGLISHMLMPDLAHTGGVKTALPAFLIIIRDCALHSHSGMRKTRF